MAERPGLTQALQRVSEANLRYYEAWGKLTVDYLSSLFGLVGELAQPGRATRTATVEAVPAAPVRAAPAPGPSTAAMVLEAEAGGQAVGAFLVENRLAQRVSTPVVASTFVDPNGREVRPRLVLDPEVVTLEPAEQLLVRVLTVVDEQLEPGVTYRGAVTVPGLTGSNVRLVLRRRADPVAHTPPTPPTPDADVLDTGGGEPPAPRPRRRATRRAKPG